VGAHDGAVQRQPPEAGDGRRRSSISVRSISHAAGQALVVAVPRAELGRQHPRWWPGAVHPTIHLERQAGWHLLNDVHAGMTLQARPAAFPLVVGKPNTGHCMQPVGELQISRSTARPRPSCRLRLAGRVATRGVNPLSALPRSGRGGCRRWRRGRAGGRARDNGRWLPAPARAPVPGPCRPGRPSWCSRFG
jgi:hypothetical protein